MTETTIEGADVAPVVLGLDNVNDDQGGGLLRATRSCHARDVERTHRASLITIADVPISAD